jgi:hypothetical protein
MTSVGTGVSAQSLALRVPVTTAVERVESVDDACGSVAEKRVRARREATDM